MKLHPMRFPEISWRGNLILANDLESSIHVDGFDYHLNFKILQHHSVRKLMHIFHWSIQIKFCEINLSEKSFQAILQCSEKKKGILVTIFTNHNAVWNSKSRVAVQFNLLSYNSLLYPYIIFFLYAAQMFLLAIYTSHLGINLTVGKNLRNRLHWIAVLVWRPFT